MGQVSHVLDTEHQATLGLLGQLDAAFVRAGRGDPDGRARVAAALIRFLADEMDRHFGFEERDLFPRLVEAGEGDMAALLAEEHLAIRAVAGELLPLARAAAAGAIDGPTLETFRRGAGELCERLTAHIQKETMALQPLLDDLLDDETDRTLAFAYATA
jgi:hemerythrin-like domain-containing protein